MESGCVCWCVATPIRAVHLHVVALVGSTGRTWQLEHQYQPSRSEHTQIQVATCTDDSSAVSAHPGPSPDPAFPQVTSTTMRQTPVLLTSPNAAKVRSTSNTATVASLGAHTAPAHQSGNTQ